MVSRQLELGFEHQPGFQPTGRSRSRSSRANWWFEQMRGLVNHARDWPPAQPRTTTPRPPAGPTGSGPPSRTNVIRTPSPAAPNASINSHTARDVSRWKFSRAKRLIWE